MNSSVALTAALAAGLVTFFGRLQAKEGNTPGLFAYLSDHPATQDRIDHVTAYIAAQHIVGTNLGADTYGRFQQRLLKLPTAAPAKAGTAAAVPAAAPPPAALPPAAPPPR